MANQSGTAPTIKPSSVIIFSATEQPGTHTAVVTVCVDLTRPSAIGRDFARALRQCSTIALPARSMDPKLYDALKLMKQGLSIAKACENTYGNTRKVSSLCRLRSGLLNAALAAK
jgi:hypothetical protein